MEIFDPNKNYGLNSTSFQLVRKENEGKIHDAKFETKPTTFAKDAFKRFCKNKSSVVGAVIIAFLLLCSFIAPIVSPYDVSNGSTYIVQKLLPPKAFKSGTGFWDGVMKYDHIVYDQDKECPADFTSHAVKDITVGEEEYTNTASKYAKGGYIELHYGTDSVTKTGNGFLYNYKDFKITATDSYVAKVVFGDVETLDDAKQTRYRTLIQYEESFETKYLEVSPWSSSYGEQSFDLSSTLSANSLTSLDKCKFRIELEDRTDGDFFLLVQSINISSSNTDVAEELASISFTDANQNALIVKNDNGTFPSNYWQSNIERYLYHASIKYCNFTYDAYDAVFGDNERIIGETLMLEYVSQGLCDYDFSIGPSSFVSKSDKCPVVSVLAQEFDAATGVNQLRTITTYYKYIGLKESPKYLLGTDKNGHDLVTKSLSSLRTSLLVATIASAVCLAIGLVWGAVAGYFGGTVDIVMERFTDILSGVPWIVMMTLIILLLGNNIITFAIALCMTDWIGPAGTTRTQFYRFKGREYVLASRTLGASDWRLIFQHIMPNGLGTIVTSCVLMIPSCIFAEASISYLGLGLQGVNSFGVILSENQVYLKTMPALVIFPSIIISLLMISFNLFGNGLRDALNPSLKGGE
ncbi:MAG: ABC transporter permease [Bacilli bacterium]|nr:ABC transporter permease [Bacilli bacterium]